MNKIIVVDDDESIQMLYAEELTEEGYDVIICGDGSRLLDLVEQEKPDLIVMDIRLGEHNGLDLLQDVRNTYYNLPVILCTAYPAFKYDLKAIAADYYVLKSSDLRELKSKIKMGLEGEIPLPSPVSHDELNNRRSTFVEQMTLPWGDTG
jgi:two-component system response regulator (stage 0 sporulation protein F)